MFFWFFPLKLNWFFPPERREGQEASSSRANSPQKKSSITKASGRNLRESKLSHLFGWLALYDSIWWKVLKEETAEDLKVNSCHVGAEL